MDVRDLPTLLEKIFIWSNMPLKQRYNTLIALVIIGSIANNYRLRSHYRSEILRLQTERNLIQREYDNFRDEQFKKLEEYDRQYKELLLETIRIKERKQESNHESIS